MGDFTTKIGVIYPSDGFLDAEFWRCVPEGVSVHVTRSMSSQDLADVSVERRHVVMAESPDIEACARTFSLIGTSCVAYACTASSFAQGVGYDVDISRRIEAASGSRATTTSTAAVAALRALGVRRIGVAAPYPDAVCERLRIFLEDSGFEVLSLTNLGLLGTAIGRVSNDEAYALAKRADTPAAEALFISCTGLRTVDIVAPLERDLGKPVVSANLATMWHSLEIAGVEARPEGLGRLYELSSLVAVAPGPSL